MISEMRAHQKLLMNRIPEQKIYVKENVVERLRELEEQLKEKEVEFQN